jgi:hypothetical protein
LNTSIEVGCELASLKAVKVLGGTNSLTPEEAACKAPYRERLSSLPVKSSPLVCATDKIPSCNKVGVNAIF